MTAPHTQTPRHKPRPGTLEREANRAAARVSGGKGAAAIGLSRTEAAPRLRRLGQGVPLPAALRAEAEDAFAADFSTVRLHPSSLDPAGPRAATAGADILLREHGLPGPDSTPLLRHELAHVLQQTGRVSANGHQRATRVYGRGCVHAEGGEYLGVKVDPAFGPIVLFEFLIKKHRAERDDGVLATADPDLLEVIKLLESQMKSVFERGKPSTTGYALEKEVCDNQVAGLTKKVTNLSCPARSLLFDVLKFAGHFEGAYKLVTHDWRLQTVAFWSPFYLFAAEKTLDPDWYDEVLRGCSTLRYFLLTRWPLTYWHYLVDPPRKVQALYKFKDYLTALWTEANDWEVLGRNERRILATEAINIIDEGRLKDLGELEGKAKKFAKTKVEMKARLSKELAVSTKNFLALKNPALGFGTVKEAYERTLVVTERASAFWSKALDQGRGIFVKTAGVDVDSLTADAAKKFILHLPENAFTAGLRKTFVDQATKLFKLGDDFEFPTRFDYAKRVGTFRKEVERLRIAVAKELRVDLPRQADPDKETQYVALGAVHYLLELTAMKLGAYDMVEDRRQEKETGTIDVRLKHRLDMALFLIRLSLMIEAFDLKQQAAMVMSGQDRRRSTLMLLSDWKEQKDVIFTEMRNDFRDLRTQEFPEISLEGGGKGRNVTLPFTAEHLIEFYRLVYDRALVGALKGLLKTTPTKFDAKTKPVLVQAYQKAAAADLPRRWRVEDAALIRVPNDGYTFLGLIGEHPKTAKQLLPKEPKLGSVIGPREDKDRIVAKYKPDVFAWIIPSVVPLIQVLKNIDAMNTVIGLTAEKAKALTDEEWLTKFSEESAKLKDTSKLVETFEAEVKKLRAAEKTELDDLIPKAITHERITMTPLLAKALDLYKEDDKKYYGKPNEVLSWLTKFIRFVQPETDQVPQLTAVLTTIAPNIQKAFAGELFFGGVASETRFDLITGYTPLLRLAHGLTTDAKWPQVQRILKPGEEGSQDQDKIDRTKARKQLGAVIESFEQAAAEMSQKLSLSSKDGKSLKSNLSRFTVKAGEPFQASGVPWQIIKVYGKFTYLPAYGKGDKQVTPPRLLGANRKPMKPSGKVLVRVQIGSGPTIDITDNLEGRNLRLLDDLSRAVANRAFQLSMENSARVLDAFAESMMDLVECIPGVGQVVMVARIVAQVAMFFAGNDYQEVLKLVRGDPAKVIRDIIDGLAGEFFEPDIVWNYLLFDGGGLKNLKKKADAAENKHKKRRRRKGKLAKVGRALTLVPVTIYKQIEKVKARTGKPVRVIQGYIQGRPQVAAAIDLAAVLLASAAVTSPGNLANAISDEGAELDEKLSELLQTINEFELPEELIPLKVLVAAILEMVTDVVLRGCFGKLAEGGLRATGVLDQIASDIGRSLAGTAADPNEFWRSEFRPGLQTAIDGSKKDFVASANDILQKFGMTGLKEPEKTKLGDAPQLELQGYEAELAAGPPPAVGLGAGRPLPAAARGAAERGFGHDFGHVRLHTGSDAVRLTSHYGADALTSGSHVMMAPHLNAESGSGQRVLHHELGHVLQQTGPRPLGQPVAASPVPGRPGRGLNFDRRAEAEADGLASQAAAPGHRAGAPLAVSGRSVDGFSPALDPVLFARILSKFNAPAEITEFYEDVKRASLTTLTAENIKPAKEIWTDTVDKLRKIANTGSGFKSNTDAPGVPKAIKDYLLSTGAGAPQKTIQAAVPALTTMAEKTVRKGKKAKPELNHRLFANLLEGFIYGRTGVSLQISLNSSGRFSKLSVLSVDLGRADGRSGLWTIAKDNTTDLINVQKAKPTHQHWTAMTSKDWSKLRQSIRVSGPRPGTMHRTKFRFSEDTLNEFFLLKSQAAGITVPNWANYTKTALTGSQGPQRLRVGTHEQLSKPGVPARDSHHMPQFLLVQYFSNQATRRLFGPGIGPRPPGFEPAKSKEPERFSDGTHSINLKALKKSRGLAMPAVSIARSTHQTGGLHVLGEKNWSGDDQDAPKNQGTAIERVFRKRFIAATPHDSYDEAITWANQPKNKRKGAQAVYTAMTGTYKWIYGTVMRPALIDILPEQEVRFYVTAVVTQFDVKDDDPLPDAYDPSKEIGKLDRVITAIDALQRTNPISGFRG